MDIHSDNHDHHPEFDQVRACIQLHNLPTLALKLRNSLSPPNPPLDCHVLPTPIFRSHHILFHLQFTDGISWLLKVPQNGHPDAFDDTSARSLRSEALTMNLIKRETTIPIPEVYSFNDSCNNPLHCPFILMDRIDSLPLFDVWFDRGSPWDVVEQRRSQVLHDVARAMLQLNKFSFSRGGALLFDTAGENLSDIDSFRIPDIESTLNYLRQDPSFTTNPFRTIHPLLTEKSYFTCMLESRNPPADDEFTLGLYKLLRLFIDLVFLERGSRSTFVLSHPDLDMHNILVDKDGRLRGLIGWDSVIAVPVCLGNERYPSWLTRDWDPVKYWYTPGVRGIDRVENSPFELKLYRELYRGVIAETQSSDSAKMTASSLLLGNLAVAAWDPVSMGDIVVGVFEEVRVVTGQVAFVEGVWGGGSFDVRHVATAFARGELEEGALQRLMDGFRVLLGCVGR